MVEDQWQKSYKLRKSIERGEMPLSRAAVDDSRQTLPNFRGME